MTATLAYGADPMSDTSDAEPILYRQHRFQRPPGACEILLVRHGESEPARMDRPFPLVDGHADPALDPVGERQAELVAERLAGERLAAIYITTLRRTHQTAAPLARRLGLEPIVERDLREVHLGEWEGGLFRKQMADGHPVAKAMMAEQRWDLAPGAEPGETFVLRVRGAIARIAAAHPDQKVAVFAHGGTIGQVLADACRAGRSLAFSGTDNGAISHIVVTESVWMIRRYNDTSHLESQFSDAPEALI
jgi:2,3-bisphosphoglycerate-dependent phosphoglycerate mutase